MSARTPRARLMAIIEGAGLTRFLSALGPTTAALVVQFGAFAITARGLGVNAFGEYAALLGLSAIGVEMVGVGGADLLVRAVSRDPTSFPRFLGNALLLIVATLPLVVVLGTALAVALIGTAIPPLFVALALAGEITIGRIAATVELAMVAHGHTTRASMVRMATAVTRLIAAGGYFLMASALTGWIVTVLVQSLLLSAVLLATTARLYGRPHIALLRGEFVDGASFAVNQLARSMQGNVDRVILAYFATSAVLGAYAAGARVMLIGVFPLQVMTRILYPQFFRHGEEGVAGTRRFAVRSLPTMLAMGVLASAAVAVVGWLAPTVLGHDFAAARSAAMLLGLAMPLIALQYLAADILTGAGHQHIRAVIFAISAMIFGLLLAVGARLGGVGGLIAAFLAAHALLAAVLWLVAFTLRDRAAK